MFWFFNNLIRKEKYGSGDLGLFQIESITNALKITFVPGFSFIFVFFIIILLSLLLKKCFFVRKKSNLNLKINQKIFSINKITFLFFISFLLGIMLLCKNPVSRYFLPTGILVSYYFSILYSFNKLEYQEIFKFGNQFIFKKKTTFFPLILTSVLASLIFKISLLAKNELQSYRVNPAINSEIQSIISNNSSLCYYRFPTKKCSIAFALTYNGKLAGNQLYKGIKSLVGNEIRDFSNNKEFDILSSRKTKKINKDILLLKKKYKFPDALLPSLKNKNLIYENDKISLIEVEYYLK